MIKRKVRFRINMIILALSLLGFWFLDWPLEIFPCIGISWVLTYSLETVRNALSTEENEEAVRRGD